MLTTNTTSAQNRRCEPRERVRKQGCLYFLDGRTRRQCIVFDISPSGARLKVDGWRYLPEAFVVQIEDGPLRRAEIRSRKMGILGVRFVIEENVQANAVE